MSALIAETPALETRYLHAGEIFASALPARVTTILGSCVAVCLCDPRARLGGLNHFMLPDWVGHEEASGRFGNVAMIRLLTRLEELGASPGRLVAKIFGGANMGSAAATLGIGAKNVALAQRVLAELSIPIAAGDVGGRQGRKLIFQPHDGVALVKRLGTVGVGALER